MANPACPPPTTTVSILSSMTSPRAAGNNAFRLPFADDRPNAVRAKYEDAE
jgi:hypothetical protein